jgi:hypothetical protein
MTKYLTIMNGREVASNEIAAEIDWGVEYNVRTRHSRRTQLCV